MRSVRSCRMSGRVGSPWGKRTRLSRAAWRAGSRRVVVSTVVRRVVSFAGGGAVRWARPAVEVAAGCGGAFGVLVEGGCVGGTAAGGGVDGVHAAERGAGAGGVGGPAGGGAGEAGGEGGVGGAPEVAAVGCGDDQPAVLAAEDEVVVVDEAVVGVAEQDEVGQVGCSAVQPVPQVVGVQALDAGLGAAGAGATTVAA
jgi:hypothetical protein